MKKIVIIPDSFKGTMSSSKEVGEIIMEEAKKSYPEAEVIRAEVADGGEGNVEALLSAPGKRKFVTVSQPARSRSSLLRKDRRYGCNRNGSGSRSAIGWNTVGGRRDNHIRSRGIDCRCIGARGKGSYSVWVAVEQMTEAQVWQPLSGVRFSDARERNLYLSGMAPGDIDKIELEGVDDRLKTVQIIAMCDVSNPLCGSRGASAVLDLRKGLRQRM